MGVSKDLKAHLAAIPSSLGCSIAEALSRAPQRSGHSAQGSEGLLVDCSGPFSSGEPPSRQSAQLGYAVIVVAICLRNSRRSEPRSPLSALKILGWF